MKTGLFVAMTLLIGAASGTRDGEAKEMTAQLSVKAGPSGFAGGPLRFEAPGDLAKEEVLQVRDADGQDLGYAQRDGEEHVILAPPIEAGDKWTATLSPAKDAKNRVTLTRGDGEIRVEVDGKYLTSYRHGADLKKPYLYPVLLDGKLPLTRGYPMEDIEGEPRDHEHHVSWYVAHGDVNKANFWHVSDKDNSKQATEAIVEVVSGPVFGKIAARNNWVNHEGNRVCREEREYRFYADAARDRTTDMKVTFTATDGPAVFGDTKEGGVCSFRLNPKIDESHGNGRMKDSEGRETAAECWGKAAKWNDYSGELEGEAVGVAVMDHPSNLRHPTTWHIRDYGLYTANCFGLSSFTDGKENGDYTLPAGKDATFHYRVLMHFGKTDDVPLEALYTAWTEPPTATVK